MTPWQKAKEWQEKYDKHNDLSVLVGWHLANGCCYSTPTCLCLFRQCFWDGKTPQWEGEPNACFVYLAVRTGGPDLLGQLLRVAPRPLEWVVWHRNNGALKAHKFEKLLRRIQ